MRTVSHVYKRLGVGPHPDRVAESTSPHDAIMSILGATKAPVPVVDIDPPGDRDELRDPSAMAPIIAWWLEQMAFSPDPLTERMTWFWYDHFATSIRKVLAPYLMWRQHKTIRTMALAPFSELLVAVAKDPAMLVYLDGARNSAREVNENFAREVMELHTLGAGPTPNRMWWRRHEQPPVGSSTIRLSLRSRNTPATHRSESRSSSQTVMCPVPRPSWASPPTTISTASSSC